MVCSSLPWERMSGLRDVEERGVETPVTGPALCVVDVEMKREPAIVIVQSGVGYQELEVLEWKYAQRR